MLWSMRPPSMGTQRLLVYGGDRYRQCRQPWVPTLLPILLPTAFPDASALHLPQGSHLLRKTLPPLKLLSPAFFPSSFTHTQLSRLKSNRKIKIHLQSPIAMAFSPFLQSKLLKSLNTTHCVQFFTPSAFTVRSLQLFSPSTPQLKPLSLQAPMPTWFCIYGTLP